MAIFDRNDIFFLSTGLALFLLGVLGFIQINQRTDLLRATEAIATIIQSRGEVKQKSYGELDWLNAKEKAPLYLWDEVFTPPGSQAEIKFDNGQTVIRLEENSLIKIEQLDQGFQLDLIRGQLSVQKTSSVHELSIQSWGETHIIKSGEEKNRLFKAPSSEVRADQSKKLQDIERLWEQVTQIARMSGVVGEEVELVDESFLNEEISYQIVYPDGETRVYRDSSVLGLKINQPGRHQLKLFNDDRVHSFVVDLEESLSVPDILKNQKLSVHKSEKARLGVEKKSSDELFYEVYAEDKKTVLKSLKSKSEFQELKLERPGVYYWRAKKEDVSPQGELVSEVSAFQKITVKKPLISEESIKKKQTQWTRESIQKGDLTLSWKLEDEVSGGFHLLISRDIRGEEIVERINLSELDEKVVIDNLEVGRYHWALVPQEEVRDVYSETPFFEVNLKAPPRIKDLPIKDKQVMKYVARQQNRSHRITLPKIKNVEEYHLEVYQDSSLERLVHRDITTSPMSLWRSERSGEFYYRYRVKDRWGRMSGYSGVARLYFPISPTEDW